MAPQSMTAATGRLPVIMIIFERDLRVRWVNDGFERYCLIEKEAVPGLERETRGVRGCHCFLFHVFRASPSFFQVFSF